jgi:hypothetical protein
MFFDWLHFLVILTETLQSDIVESSIEVNYQLLRSAQ